MSDPQEVKRITEVYEDYQSDERTRARWDLDNPGNRMEWDRRRTLMQTMLDEHGVRPLSKKRILDIGCGRGRVLAEFRDLGVPASHLYGIDLLEDRIEQAKAAQPSMNFSCGNAQALEFADEHFDIVLLFTVFSSILDAAMRHNIAAEVGRVLKASGAVVIYDFRINNPNNPNTKAIGKADLLELFPASAFRIDARSTTLLPPLARRLGSTTRLLYPWLCRIPWLRTHYLSIIRKQAA